MKIEFEFIRKEKVNIIGVEGKIRKLIGHIFTPSGSGEDTLNAIQICGFEEAFDLWGCGIFGEEITEKRSYTKREINNIKRNRSLFKGKFGKVYGDMLKKGYEEKKNKVMKKDIQLMFSMYDEGEKFHSSISNECWGCFNNPCTCDNKQEGSRYERKNKGSPYNLKTHKRLSQELEIKKKIGG